MTAMNKSSVKISAAIIIQTAIAIPCDILPAD